MNNASMNNHDNPLREKSYQFALDVILLSRKLMDEHKEFVLSKQLLRSGTSIGANIEEAQAAQSSKDFVSKLSISLKEAYETKYWLRLLTDSKTASEIVTAPLIEKIDELLRLLTASIKTKKERL